MKQNPGGAVFNPVSAKQQSVLTPKLGNGSAVDTKLWPASFVAAGDEVCTATLIGPETLLTARHCVADGAEVTLRFPKGVLPDGENPGGPCKHPTFGDPLDFSPDWALCRISPPIKSGNIYYEHVSVDRSKTARGIRLLGTGYGCITLEKKKPEEKKAENPPVFRTGPLFVDRPPTEGAQYPNWIFTTSAKGGTAAFVCPGDSGGAVYWLSPSGARFVVAVASGVQPDPKRSDYLVSYLAAMSTKAAVDFLKSWTASGAQICGFGVSPDRCRPTP